MGFVLGIDVSTTATKAVLVDESGAVRGIGIAEYGFDVPRPLWSEQDPALWWDGTVAAIRSVRASTGVAGDEIVAIGLTGQMHGAVLLDADGAVLRPAILWNDQRTGAECDAIRAAVGPERLIAITGNDALTGFTAPKLVWVRDHEPDTWRRIVHVLLPKDYVRLRLTGDYALDKADGAGTLLFDLAARDWSPEVLAALGIDPAWMPPTFEGPTITGSISLGSGGRDRPPGRHAGRRGRGRPGRECGWRRRGRSRHDGALARDLGRHLRRDGPPDLRAARAGARLLPRGSRPLALHVGDALGGRQPALVPRRAGPRGRVRGPRRARRPRSRPEARACASFPTSPASAARTLTRWPAARSSGSTLAHDRRHMTRAVLEGVAFGLRDGLDLMVAAGMPAPAQIRASGGGTVSPLWRQILADVLEAEIATVSTSEGAAYGAGLLAAVGAGWFPTVGDATSALVTAAPVAAPGPDAAAYAAAHETYRELYPALAPTFRRL